MTNEKLNSRTFVGLLIAVALIGLVVGMQLNRQTGSPNEVVSIPRTQTAEVLPEARVLSDFALLDHERQSVNKASLEGSWSFMFFGYTNCPDICPMALTVMKQVWKKLRAEAGGIEGVNMYFVSVDPERDPPEMLKEYVQYFDPSFIGVSGSAEEIDKLANQLGVLYGFEDPKEDDGSYVVNHSAQILLLDPQSRLYAVLPPPHDPQLISEDFLSLRHHYGN